MGRYTPIAIFLALTLCAFSNRDSLMQGYAELNAVREKLSFTCAHEADYLPPLDAQVDTLFKYGLFLEKKPGPKDFDLVARYYRVSAAHGHYKANRNLQLLVSTGQAKSPSAPNETIDLVEQLIAAGIPGGYYDMGHYLELGYGVRHDERKSLIYIRKAADFGSPEAQYFVGDLLAAKDRAPDVSRQMMKCASEQGYGKAANYLGVDLSTNQLYREALEAFQRGARSGDAQSVSFLKNGFNTQPSDRLYYLGQSNDLERSRRYGLIWKFLTDHDGLNPKVPDIDQIVPLPPAELPPWDGTFQWQKEQQAAKPPQKPDEDLVERLAREKNLDPATGLPLTPPKSKKPERVPLGTTICTGEVCPQDGIWTVRYWADFGRGATRKFRKGETMPQLVLEKPRFIPLLDVLLGMRVHRTDADWSLKAYTDEA